jgi:hypothetical protein
VEGATAPIKSESKAKGKKMSFITEIETRVAGIPCIVGVTHFESVRGSFSYHAASDWDYHGYIEAEWVVCDRRGRPAPWLERKLTSKDSSRIESEIAEHFAD